MKKNLKRIFWSILAILSVMLMTSVFAFAESEEYEYGDFTYKIVDGEAVITSIDTWDHKIEIPGEIEGYKVTRIAEGTFSSYNDCDTLIIPESISVIEDGAFDGSYIRAFDVDEANLHFSSDERGVLFNKDKTVLICFPTGSDAEAYEIPDGVVEISARAFYEKCSFREISIPDSVKTIGKEAFYCCCGVETLTIGKGVTSIGEDAFLDCYNLYDVRYTGSEAEWKKISISSGNDWLIYVADIEFNYDSASAYKCGDNAFWAFDEEALTLTISGTGDMYDYDYLGRGPWYKQIDKLIESAKIKVVVEEGITSIGDYCFSEDYYSHFVKCHITEISLPESLGEIGIGAFQNCVYLKEITIPKNVESIGAIAFSDSSLEKVTLPEKITRIEEGTFNDTELTHIVIPDGVEYIGVQAFCDGFALNTIVLPDSVKEIDKCAFGIITGNAARLDVRGKRYIYYTGTPEQYSQIKINVGELGGTNEYKYGMLLGKGTEMIYNYNGTDHFHVHSFSDRVYPTCETDGYKRYICDCGDEYKITVEALDHWYPFENIVSVRKKATTTSDGLCSAKCAREGCGNIDNEVIIKKIARVELSSTTFAYDGKNKKPDVRGIYDSNKNYIGSENYTVEYQTSCSKIGTHKLRIIFKGKLYEGSVIMNYSILQIKQNTTQIGFAWAAVNGADGYAIYQHKDGKWSLLGLRSKTNAIIGNLNPGTEYTFAVRALAVKNGKYIFAKNYTLINTATMPEAPKRITASEVEDNTTQIGLEWTECEGAYGYRIYYKTGSGWKIAYNSTYSNDHTFFDLNPGSKFTFAVRPYIITDSGVVWGAYTTYTAATAPPAPKTAVSSTAKGKINVKWSAVNGAEAYQLFFKVGNGGYQLFRNYTSVQNLNFNSLPSGTNYTFAVRAAKKTSGGWIFSDYNPVSVTVK